MKSNTMQSLFLAIEAGLVLAAVLMGNAGIVGFACYWGLVAFYHLSDFLFQAAADSLEKKKEAADGKQRD